MAEIEALVGQEPLPRQQWALQDMRSRRLGGSSGGLHGRSKAAAALARATSEGAQQRKQQP
jgi:hypothetical protein